MIKISEKKLKIVIDNYFKSECSIDMNLRQAFEKGFRIGVQKGLQVSQSQVDRSEDPEKKSKNLKEEVTN